MSGIKILDLCCGHGKPTYDLYNKLISAGVKVEKIVGVDISEDQIKLAIGNYGHIIDIEFYVKNVEEISFNHDFDITVSLFGLHWVNNLEHTAFLIHNSLKPSGKLMFFVPLEKLDLFTLRDNFIKIGKWKESFEGFAIKPFLEKPEDYRSIFDKLFTHKPEDKVASGATEFIYTREQFCSFLSSWIPELRFLKSTGTHEGYIEGLIDTITKDSENIKLDGSSIKFTEHFFHYEGEAMELPMLGDISYALPPE